MIAELREKFPKISWQSNVALRRHTTFQVGGPATVFAEIFSEDELVGVLVYLRGNCRRHLVIGGGSNLLFDSDGFDGIIIKNRIAQIHRRDEGIEASGGFPLQDALEFALNHRLSGIEFAAGIPGTLGGGLAGNAGAYGSNLGEFLAHARVLTAAGNIVAAGPEYFSFGYRSSRLQQNSEIILSATIRLDEIPAIDESRRRCREILDKRASKHPGTDMPSAGSFFKNLDQFDESGRRVPAGLLLDQAGCKSLAVGDAHVFPRHANIIVNRGEATSRDVLQLAAEMKRRVLEKFGIELEPEVRYVPVR